ncbi:MAG: hypothetical protein KDA89_10110 [Planctomycetaceae bacterium]|nr:hypothetical protein [Planctomycetaceae bacterium]
MDHAERIAHVIGGMMFGLLAAALPIIKIAFLVASHNWQHPIKIAFGLLATAAAIGGVLGYRFGDRFITWMSEHWNRISDRHEFINIDVDDPVG